MYIQLYTDVYTYMHMHMYIRICVCICNHMYMYMHVHICIMNMYMHMHMDMYMYVYMYMDMYIIHHHISYGSQISFQSLAGVQELTAITSHLPGKFEFVYAPKVQAGFARVCKLYEIGDT